MSDTDAPPVRPMARTPVLDWVRGVAIILVVLSHMWALWSFDSLSGVPPLLHVLQSGNVAVTVFLVVSGFLLTRSLIGPAGTREDDAGRPGAIAARRPALAVVTRVVRIAAQTYPLLLLVWFVTLAEGANALLETQTERSVLWSATFGWNIYLQSQALLARADLGHLWYTSVYVQVAVLLVVLVRGLRHRRLVLAATLGGLLLACTLWRAHVAEVEPLTTALLRTTTRMDGMLWGALAAVLWPWLGPVRRVSGTVVSYSLAGFAVLVLVLGNSGAYLGWGGVAANLAVVAVIVAAPGLPPGGRLARVLSWGPMVGLGRYSLALYVWHYPIFFGVGQRAPGWPAPAKAALALALLAVAVVLTVRYVERPVERWMSARLRTRPADGEEISAAPRLDASVSVVGAAAGRGPGRPGPSRP